MSWNWELPDWPHFTFNPKQLHQKEKDFLLNVGSAHAFLKNIDANDFQQFVVEVLSNEGMESSRIEGEILDRESLQSSIKDQFGLKKSSKKDGKKESQMAEILCDVYKNYDKPLTHQMLFTWHGELFKNNSNIEDLGRYRTHSDTMQIVSNRYGSKRVFFEAPPSKKIKTEMKHFIQWFNGSKENGILARAAIAHVYFESIHPFEDGNGRLGRLLVEKVLSQGVESPILIAVSKVLEKRKKEYYEELGRCNRTLKIDNWVNFFSDVILQAQKESLSLLYFLIAKSKLLTKLRGEINPRQEKVLLRMFAEGPSGFKGGLSAENYISITKTSRATATRDLNELVEKKALIKTGELRHTRYWLILKERIKMTKI